MHCLLGDGLLATLGEHHRKQRRLLNPVFSIAHTRHMLPIFYNITSKLQEAISRQVKGGQQEIDVLDWMGRTALALVGQAGLCWSFDPLLSDTVGTNLGTAVKALVCVRSISFCQSVHGTDLSIRSIQPILCPHPYAALLAPTCSEDRLSRASTMAGRRRPARGGAASEAHRRRDRLLFAAHLRGEEACHARRRRGGDAPNRRRQRHHEQAECVPIANFVYSADFTLSLVQANMAANEADKLPEDEILGQMAYVVARVLEHWLTCCLAFRTFIFAGMDTTSNALARTIDILSKHPDVQDKLRAEVLEAMHEYGTEIPYDVLVELPTWTQFVERPFNCEVLLQRAYLV